MISHISLSNLGKKVLFVYSIMYLEGNLGKEL